MIYLLLILLLCSSCNPGAAPAGPTDTATSTVPASAQPMDTLKYTSGIRAILHDSKGNYWLGSHQEGACRFDGTNFTYFTTAYGLNDNQVRRIMEDGDGNIWFGTAAGVSSFDGERITNHTAIPEVYQPFTLNHRNEFGEWQLTSDDLWFNAGDRPGVYRYDGQAVRYLKFPLREKDGQPAAHSATAFARGRERIWVATYGAVCGYDGENFEFIKDEDLGYDYESNGLYLHVRSIFEDSQGRLWIGNNGLGVLLRENDHIINFSEREGLVAPGSKRNGSRSPEGTLEHVFAITEDKDGNIWFGDRDTGAWKYDGETMTHYVIDPTLESPMVWDIYENRAGELLFALAKGGVYKFNGKDFVSMF